MTYSLPVIEEARSDARNATSSATSSGRFGLPSLDFHSAGKQLTLMVEGWLGLGKLDDEFFPGEPMHRSRRVRQSRRDKVRIVSAFVE